MERPQEDRAIHSAQEDRVINLSGQGRLKAPRSNANEPAPCPRCGYAHRIYQIPLRPTFAETDYGVGIDEPTHEYRRQILSNQEK